MPEKTNNKNKKPAVKSVPAGSNNKKKKSAPAKNKNNPKNNKKAVNNPPKNNKNKKKDSVSFSEKYKQFKKDYNVGKIALALAVSLAIVIALVIVVLGVFSGDSIPEQVKNAEFKGRIEPDGVVSSIAISKNQQEILASSTGAKGKKSAFSFFVNKEMFAEEATDPLLLEFGSLESNDCDLVVFLLDKEGNILYRSLGVEPGKEIQSINLFEEMPYGTHKMNMVVVGYDKDTYKKIGTQTTEITLKIGVD